MGRLAMRWVVGGTGALALATAGLVATTPSAGATPSCTGTTTVTCTFAFTGLLGDSFTVPAGVTLISIDAFGAQGGPSQDGTLGGRGGEATATITVTPGEVLQVNVGGRPDAGNPAVGGINGGGASGTSIGEAGGGGGGASDVRQGGHSNGDRVVIAGGGGGGGSNGSCTGGTGGDTNGGDGSTCSTLHLQGLGGTPNTGGGGGGSGLTPSGTSMKPGVQTGPGLITITYTLPTSATPVFSGPASAQVVGPNFTG